MEDEGSLFVDLDAIIKRCVTRSKTVSRDNWSRFIAVALSDYGRPETVTFKSDSLTNIYFAKDVMAPKTSGASSVRTALPGSNFVFDTPA